MRRPPADPAAFAEAVRWFRARIPMTDEEFAALEEQSYRRAFTIAGVAQLDLVTQVYEAVDRAVAQGETLDSFRDAVGDRLTAAWGKEMPWRVETIFRTNAQSAYAEGRWEQQQHPAVKRARPFKRFNAVMDDRTTDICAELDGTVLPEDDPFWATHLPPLHFNAVTADTLITTDVGLVPAGAMMPGLRVLTHRRRWRTVTAVLHKLVEGKRVRSLHLASGRVLRVTDEHPVLVHAPANGLRWRKAADLQVGDQLLEHGHQMTRAPDVRICDADDAPPLANEMHVPGAPLGSPLCAPVILPVYLDSHQLGDEGQVEDVPAYDILSDGPAAEQGEKVLLSWGEFLPERCCEGGTHLLAHTRHMNRVAGAHAQRAVRALDAPRPVVRSAALGDDVGTAVHATRHLLLRANGQPVAADPIRERGLSEPEFALDLSDAAPLPPVLGFDDGLDGAPVPEIEWHVSAITTIVDAVYAGEVCDLSVDEDETYVAGGVVVHNCRSHVDSLSKSEAEEEGIDPEPPAVDAADGFGLAPTHRPADPEPDLDGYPPALAAEYRRVA